MDEFAVFFGVFFTIWLTLMLVVLAYSITAYVLGCLGLYQIAKRRGIHNPWLAWLPVGNSWIVGAISDHYQHVSRGKERNYRKVLMWLEIGVLAISMITIVFSLVMNVGLGIGVVAESDTAVFGTAMIMAGISLILTIALYAVGITGAVFTYICYYDVLRSCKPKSTVLFMVLGILLNIMPFFIFACRKADEGMPPKIKKTA